MDLAARNARVVAVDISPSLIKIARERFSRNDECKHNGEVKLFGEICQIRLLVILTISY